MKYLVIFEQRGDTLKIFIKDDLTPDQAKQLEACNGYLQNNGNPTEIESKLDDLCGVIFEGEWDADKVYDSEDDEGAEPYEINAPAIGLKVIHTGSV